MRALAYCRLLAGCHDAIVIHVEIVDARGRVAPFVDPLVIFQVEGPARIIGAGNGNPGSHKPDRADFCRAFNGYCQIILQAGDAEGKIPVTSSVDGLLSGRIELDCVISG